jgi:hypothetical protein
MLSVERVASGLKAQRFATPAAAPGMLLVPVL